MYLELSVQYKTHPWHAQFCLAVILISVYCDHFEDCFVFAEPRTPLHLYY